LRFENYPPGISDLILKLKGGSDELTHEEQERLVKSILAKAPESNYTEISINKFLKKILKLSDPVISNEKLCRILSELEKPLKPQFSDGNPISSTDILGPYAPDKQAKPRSRSSSSIFVEGFPTRLSPMQKRVQRHRALILSKKEPTLTPTMLKASQVPMSDLFSADSVTGNIHNINIAFNQFKQRMTQIGNQYTGEKQQYFF
jgi:hypothetical protein